MYQTGPYSLDSHTQLRSPSPSDHNYSFLKFRSSTETELLAEIVICENLICLFGLHEEMGKSRSSLVFRSDSFIDRLISLPFHAFAYSSTNSSTRENAKNPNQNHNQLLKSAKDHCKCGTFRNLDHALGLFD